jgi:flagellar basal body P-ring formation chaperone FlgA
MRYSRSQILLLFVLVFASSAARADGLRVTLLADAVVQGDTILLANLLPENAPRPLRAAAEAISLGTAPQNGTARRFRRDAILAALQSATLSPASFLIPEVVTVRRAERLLTQEEALAAIQSALAKSHIAGAPEFRPEDLTLDAALAVPSAGARLEVTQIAFDEAIGRARFRLQPHTAPGANAFFVTARVAPEAPARISTAAPRLTSMSTKALSVVDLPVLVDPRQFARLRLRSPSAEMLLAVKPLQRGHLGETIRVRLQSSGKTLRGRVTGKDFLEAVF